MLVLNPLLEAVRVCTLVDQLQRNGTEGEPLLEELLGVRLIVAFQVIGIKGLRNAADACKAQGRPSAGCHH